MKFVKSYWSSEKAESAFSKERKPLSVKQKVPSVEKKKGRRQVLSSEGSITRRKTRISFSEQTIIFQIREESVFHGGQFC
jgi:hypothetical protein